MSSREGRSYLDSILGIPKVFFAFASSKTVRVSCVRGGERHIDEESALEICARAVASAANTALLSLLDIFSKLNTNIYFEMTIE